MLHLLCWDAGCIRGRAASPAHVCWQVVRCYQRCTQDMLSIALLQAQVLR